MLEYLKKYWEIFSLSVLVWGVTIYTVTKKPITKELKPEHIVSPKTDSLIAAADTIVKFLEVQKKKELVLKKEKEKVEKELRIERKKKSKVEKGATKVIVQTKEVIVEKEVKVQDPSIKDVILENYKIQNENNHLKEELEHFKKNVSTPKLRQIDSISTDTVKRKKKKFLLF